MLVLFTDFGSQDPYVGQLRMRLAELAPNVPCIDLLHEVPAFNAHAGAHLLDALKDTAPVGAILLCVIDPGVGSAREALVLEADGRWYVGPDNGLLSIVAARATCARYRRIVWRPEHISATFHGRDLFAPVAARLATGALPDDWLAPCSSAVEFAAGDLDRILYIDHYGNAWTGLRASGMSEGATLGVAGRSLPQGGIYSESAKGEAFWYANSVGLVEVAANRVSAAALLGLAVGDRVMSGATGGGRLH